MRGGDGLGWAGLVVIVGIVDADRDGGYEV